MASNGTAPFDRRQRKTRESLRWALLTLLAQKPYGEITVDDVTIAADVARTTFYAHYRDKSDLLEEATRDLLDCLEHQFTAVSWSNAPTYDASGLFGLLLHVARHHELYRVVISGEGGTGPRQALVTSLRDAAAAGLTAGIGQAPECRLPLHLVTTSFVGALLATIEAWLDGALDMDPSALAISLMRQQVDGLEWALGFQSGQMVFASPRAAAVEEAAELAPPLRGPA